MIVWSDMSHCSGVGRGRECNPRKDAWHGDRGEQLRISLRNVHPPTAKPVGGHAPDYQELLREFVEGGGSFVLVGGVGGCGPRPPRATDDVDLFVEASEEDSVRVFDALDRFGPPLALHGVTAGLFGLAGRRTSPTSRHSASESHCGQPFAGVTVSMGSSSLSSADTRWEGAIERPPRGCG
jgi:hypothetical protein